MKKTIFAHSLRLTLGGLLFFLTSETCLAAEVQARSNGAVLYQEATSESPVRRTLRAGEKLEASERVGMFWRVKERDGNLGYMSVTAVHYRAGGDSSLAAAISRLVKVEKEEHASITERPRDRSAVMGVRGLSVDDHLADAGSARPDLRAVYRLEAAELPHGAVQRLGEAVFSEIMAKSAPIGVLGGQ